jgi:hypothetical protein
MSDQPNEQPTPVIVVKFPYFTNESYEFLTKVFAAGEANPNALLPADHDLLIEMGMSIVERAYPGIGRDDAHNVALYAFLWSYHQGQKKAWEDRAKKAEATLAIPWYGELVYIAVAVMMALLLATPLIQSMEHGLPSLIALGLVAVVSIGVGYGGLRFMRYAHAKDVEARYPKN